MQEPVPGVRRETLYEEEQRRQSAVEEGEHVRQRGSRQETEPQVLLESCLLEQEGIGFGRVSWEWIGVGIKEKSENRRRRRI